MFLWPRKAHQLTVSPQYAFIWLVLHKVTVSGLDNMNSIPCTIGKDRKRVNRFILWHKSPKVRSAFLLKNIARIAKAASHKLPGKSCPDHHDHHDHPVHHDHHDKHDHYDHHHHHDRGDHDDQGDHEEVGRYMRTRKLEVIWKANQPWVNEWITHCSSS